MTDGSGLLPLPSLAASVCPKRASRCPTAQMTGLMCAAVWILAYTCMVFAFGSPEIHDEVPLAPPVSWKQSVPPIYKQALALNRYPALITFATGKKYGAAQVHFFANSFQRWAPWEAKIVFFTDDGLVPAGFTVPRPENVIFVNASAVDISVAPENATKLPVIRRFFIYKAWLESHAANFST